MNNLNIYSFQYQDSKGKIYNVKCVAENYDKAYFDLKKQLPSSCKNIKRV